MAETIYWHDYETFGANPSIDRPSQFAGIRTDLDLEVIGDPLMIYCQPVDDLLPNPDACLITGITPQMATEQGVSEPEFIRQIHSEFIQPQTCGAGYNSLRFDDEVTRYTLYRNFYDPYAREWQQGNSRWDIIDMVRLVYAIRPDALKWPEREPGIPSFRLELLSEANGLEHSSAHDAMSDVMATIALARQIKQREPGLYEYCWKSRLKTEITKQIDLKSHRPLLHVSSKIPARQGCTTLIMPLAMHPNNKNAVICIDLCADIEPLLDLDAETIKDRLYTRSDELSDNESRIPLKAIHLNRCPVILPLKMLEESNARRLGIDLAVAEQKWQRLLQTVREIEKKALHAFDTSFDEIPDADSALYQGFIPDRDRAVADQVKAANDAEIKSHNFLFQDRRLNELFFRYRARHYPQSLSEAEYQLWREQVCERQHWPKKLDAYEQDLALRIEQETDLSRCKILEKLVLWSRQRRDKFCT